MPTETTAAARLLADFIAALTHGELTAVTDVKGVQARLCGLGFDEECSRCGGCGSYGPTSVEAGRCFGCGGRCKVAPRLSRALLTRVQAEVTVETLDAYATACKARAAAKRAAKGAGERVTAAYSQTIFMRHYYTGNGGRFNESLPYSPLAFAIHDGEKTAVQAMHDAEFAAKRGQGSADAVLAAEAAVVLARAVQDRAFAAALASGELDVNAAEYADVRAMRDDQTMAGWLVSLHETGFRRRTYERAQALLAAAELE